MWSLSPEHTAAQQLLDLHQERAVMAATPTLETLPSEVVVEALRDVSLEELGRHRGAEGGRILLSFDGNIFDVSSAHDLFGPDGQYAALAGADVTRCLGEMCLDDECLDDLGWEPDDIGERKQLNEWKQLLRTRYPVVGALKPRVRVSRVATPPLAPATPTTFGIELSLPEAPQAAVQGSPAKAGAGFMAGKSLVATAEKQRRQRAMGGDSDSLMYKLCPLHADDATLKLVAVTAAVAWVSGALLGWNLHRKLQVLS